MIKITKDVTVTIDEGDVQTLCNVCESARCYFTYTAGKFGQWTEEEYWDIKNFLTRIFEGS